MTKLNGVVKLKIDYILRNSDAVYAGAQLIDEGLSLTKKKLLERVKDNILNGNSLMCPNCDSDSNKDYYLKLDVNWSSIMVATSFVEKYWCEK